MLFLVGFYAGPVIAEAMFVNREEIPVYPIYRDPVRFMLLFSILDGFDPSHSHLPLVLFVISYLSL